MSGGEFVLVVDFAVCSAAAVVAIAAATRWRSGQPALEQVPLDETVAVAETLSAGTLVVAGALPEFRVELVLGEERVNE